MCPVTQDMQEMSPQPTSNEEVMTDVLVREPRCLLGMARSSPQPSNNLRTALGKGLQEFSAADTVSEFRKRGK